MNKPPSRAWRRTFAATLIALSVGAALAADPKASQYYEDALVRFEKKDMKGAIVQLKNAIKLDRRVLPVHVLLGRALLADGEINAAEAAFDEALKLGVNPSEVLLPLAETYTAQGKPEILLSDARFAHSSLAPQLKGQLLLIKAGAASDLGRPRDALRLLEEARALDSGSAASWTAEVPIRVRARQFGEAKAAADKAVALDPKSSKAAYQQATVAHVTGDLKLAVQLYSRTMELKPDHVDALVARAGLHIDLNQFDQATADVKAARKADPRDPRSAYLAALLAERAGQASEAKRALNEVTSLVDPLPIDYLRFRPQVLMLGGMSHFALDQFEKAKPYLEMVLRQDVNSPVSKLLAQIYLREKRLDKATESLEAYLRSHSGDQQATLLLASTQMALGRHARAAQLTEEALKKSDDPSMRALLGMSLVGAGKFEPGAAELEATLKKDPDQLQAGVSLAGIYIASGQAPKAVAVAQRLVARQPKNPGLQNLLGSALAAAGDAAQARAAFERSRQLDPGFVEPQLNLARLDIDQKDWDAANKRLNAILAKDEKHVDAMMETARMFSGSGRADESLRWLQKADDNSGARLQPGLQLIEFHLARDRPDLARDALRRLQGKAPESLVVLRAQARVQLALGETAEARTTLTRATTVVAYDAAALAGIAELQVRAGNLPGAGHALDKALAAKPTHLRARALRSSVYMLEGDLAKAEQLARSVAASDPKIGMGEALLGDVARARGQLPLAVESYRRAHQLDRNAESLLRLFAALDGTQQPAAVALAAQWLRANPQDVSVWRALGDSNARAGHLQAAKTAYENASRLAPADADALNNLAIVLIGLKDPGALKLAERALAIKPQTPHIIGTTGWAAFHAGQTDRGLQLLRDARLRDPANPGTRYFLGAVLAHQGRKTEARTEIEAALSGGLGAIYAPDARSLLQTLK